MSAALKSDPFEETILASVNGFGCAMAGTIESMFSQKCEVGAARFATGDMGTGYNFFVSILFAGTVYGEFFLAMDQKVAAEIAGLDPNSTQNEISELWSEILNIAVGESILGLTKVYKKLTMTPPRVCFGNMVYSQVKNGKISVYSKKGQVDCYLFVDRMKLDLASSYKEILASLKLANHQLQNALKKLKDQQNHLVQSEKMAALGILAAGVAHEINTPLTAISHIEGSIKSLLGEPSVPSVQLVPLLKTIDEATRRIAKITNGLRSFATNSDDKTFTMAKVDSIIDEALVFCEHRFTAANIKLTKRSFANDLQVECRPHEIAQVVLSVLQNAGDAIESQTDKWVDLEVIKGGNDIFIVISDSGKGISEVDREKIFIPFFTTKAVGKGTGLGLSIAKSCIEAHKGSIAFDEKGKNTRFVIRLPQRQSASTS